VHRGSNRLLQLTDEPLLKWAITIPLAGEGRDESDRGKAVLGQGSAEGVIQEPIRLRGISVEIQDDRRVFSADGTNDVEVDRVSTPPLYAQEFSCERGAIYGQNLRSMQDAKNRVLLCQKRDKTNESIGLTSRTIGDHVPYRRRQ
jgi:hypothetical protein